MKIRTAALAVGIMLAPGVMLAPVWLNGGLGAGEDDILYYFPARAFFHEAIRSGDWPSINPWTGLGRPYVADPQSAVFYPPTWLFALLTPGFAYVLSLWLHFSLALWGAYRLLRGMRLNRLAAGFGGAAFAFCGFMLAHRVHFSMQHAAAWTPWVLWRLSRFAALGGGRRLAPVALCAAMQVLAGHVQIAALTCLASLPFLIARSGLTWKLLRRWLAAWLAAAGICAIQALPTLAYLPHTTRLERGYGDFVENSWHPASLVSWLLPMFFGQRTPNFFSQPYWGPSYQSEQLAYIGFAPLVLALLTLRRNWRADGDRRGLTVLLLFAILLALGEYGPICPLLYWLPGSSLFRVPARAMLIVDLAIAGLAAAALHDLTSRHSPARVRLRASALAWTRKPVVISAIAIAAPLLSLTLAAPFADAQSRAALSTALSHLNPAIWFPLLLLTGTLLAIRILARGWRRRAPAWPILVIAALDLALIGWTLDVPRQARGAATMLHPPEQERWLSHMRDSPHRLWVVSDTKGIYDRPAAKLAANTNALAHIRGLTDYGPLQPRSVTEVFDFKPWGATRKAAELLRDTEWMRAYDVEWVLLCDPGLPAPQGCEAVDSLGPEFRLYRYANPAGRAFIDDEPRDEVRYARTTLGKFTTTVEARTAAGPNTERTLVVSQLWLPGWTVREDGRRLPVFSAHGALLATRVAADRTVRLQWSYETPGLRIGAMISAAVLLGLGIAVLAARRTPRRDNRSTRSHGDEST